MHFFRNSGAASDRSPPAVNTPTSRSCTNSSSAAMGGAGNSSGAANDGRPPIAPATPTISGTFADASPSPPPPPSPHQQQWQQNGGDGGRTSLVGGFDGSANMMLTAVHPLPLAMMAGGGALPAEEEEEEGAQSYRELQRGSVLNPVTFVPSSFPSPPSASSSAAAPLPISLMSHSVGSASYDASGVAAGDVGIVGAAGGCGGISVLSPPSSMYVSSPSYCEGAVTAAQRGSSGNSSGAAVTPYSTSAVRSSPPNGVRVGGSDDGSSTTASSVVTLAVRGSSGSSSASREGTAACCSDSSPQPSTVASPSAYTPPVACAATPPSPSASSQHYNGAPPQHYSAQGHHHSARLHLAAASSPSHHAHHMYQHTPQGHARSGSATANGINSGDRGGHHRRHPTTSHSHGPPSSSSSSFLPAWFPFLSAAGQPAKSRRFRHSGAMRGYLPYCCGCGGCLVSTCNSGNFKGVLFVWCLVVVVLYVGGVALWSGGSGASSSDSSSNGASLQQHLLGAADSAATKGKKRRPRRAYSRFFINGTTDPEGLGSAVQQYFEGSGVGSSSSGSSRRSVVLRAEAAPRGSSGVAATTDSSLEAAAVAFGSSVGVVDNRGRNSLRLGSTASTAVSALSVSSVDPVFFTEFVTNASTAFLRSDEAAGGGGGDDYVPPYRDMPFSPLLRRAKVVPKYKGIFNRVHKIVDYYSDKVCEVQVQKAPKERAKEGEGAQQRRTFENSDVMARRDDSRAILPRCPDYSRVDARAGVSAADVAIASAKGDFPLEMVPMASPHHSGGGGGGGGGVSNPPPGSCPAHLLLDEPSSYQFTNASWDALHPSLYDRLTIKVLRALISNGGCDDVPDFTSPAVQEEFLKPLHDEFGDEMTVLSYGAACGHMGDEFLTRFFAGAGRINFMGVDHRGSMIEYAKANHAKRSSELLSWSVFQPSTVHYCHAKDGYHYHRSRSHHNQEQQQQAQQQRGGGGGSDDGGVGGRGGGAADEKSERRSSGHPSALPWVPSNTFNIVLAHDKLRMYADHRVAGVGGDGNSYDDAAAVAAVDRTAAQQQEGLCAVVTELLRVTKVGGAVWAGHIEDPLQIEALSKCRVPRCEGYGVEVTKIKERLFLSKMHGLPTALYANTYSFVWRKETLNFFEDAADAEAQNAAAGGGDGGASGDNSGEQKRVPPSLKGRSVRVDLMNL